MLIATETSTGTPYIVARERGGEHGIELVAYSGYIRIVPSLDGFTTTYRERPIRSDRALLADRPPDWLAALRSARAKHITDSIAGKVKTRKVEKSSEPGGPRIKSPRGPGKKALAAQANAEAQATLEKNLASLPPETRAMVRKNLGLPPE